MSIDDMNDRYGADCFLYFCRRYKARLKSLNLSPYPLPPDLDLPLPEVLKRDVEAILSHLLNDTEFYQGRVHALTSLLDVDLNPSQNFHLGRVLWEMEGLDPGELIFLCDSIKHPHSKFPALYTDHLKRWLANLHRGSAPGLKHDSLQDFENFMQQWPEDGSGRIQAIIRRISIPKLKSVLGEHKLDRAWNIGVSRLTEEHYPLEYGLLVFIRLCWPAMASSYIQRIIPLLPDSTKSGLLPPETSLLSSILAEVSFDDDDEKEVPRAVHILFAPAGTGKTRRIFELLHQRWGFYISPPNLVPPTTSPGIGADWDSNMLHPQRLFGSRDTYSFFLDCPIIPKSSAAINVNLYEHILIARFALFREFLLQSPEPDPRQWLLIQISCADMDPFDALSRLFRLAQDDVLGFGHSDYEREYECQVVSTVASMQLCVEATKTKVNARFFDEGHTYFCFDEAQTMLGNERASRMMDHMYEAVLCLYAMTKCEHGHQTEASSGDTYDEDMDSAMAESASVEPSYSVIDPMLIFSGTALDIDKMKIAIDSALNVLFDKETPPPQKWKEQHVHHSFPLVANDGSFWQLYKMHITELVSEQLATERSSQVSPSTRPLLSRSGRPLTLRQIESNGQVPQEYLESETWLWRPLQTRPVAEIVDLICRISSLPQLESASASARIPCGLEAVLDLQDPVRVTAEMRYLVHQLRNVNLDDPREIRVALLDLLAEHGGMSPDAVTELIEATSKTSFHGGDLPNLAAVLFEQLRDVYIRQLIVNNSKVLRGRYRWSTAYIEAILTEASRLEYRMPEVATIRNITENARHNVSALATKGLQRQMHRMTLQGKSGLVQDLHRAGIRAEIMGRPTIFLDPSHAELVTHGFALVENYGRDGVKFKLAEPLAVHAIMHHLRGRGRKEYHQLMLQWLIHTQDDHEVQAMFGKAAEWYIAAHFDRLLCVQDSENILFEPRHREAMRHLLGNSRTCRSTASKGVLLKSLVHVEDFVLAHSPTEYNYQSHSMIWDWMKQYRTRGPQSTSRFLFPVTTAGPDLVFVLEKSPPRHGTKRADQVSRILVVVQVKTGRVSLEKAMDKLLVSGWHQGSSSAAAHSEELKSDFWQNTPVLLILVSTGTELNSKTADEWLGANHHSSKANHFYCFVDERVAEDVWGPDFCSIAVAIKKRKEKGER